MPIEKINKRLKFEKEI